MRLLSLPIAVAYLAVSPVFGVGPFVLVAVWLACCLPIIWCSEEMSRANGMLYVSAVTGESPRAMIRQAGWFLLLLPGALACASWLLQR